MFERGNYLVLSMEDSREVYRHSVCLDAFLLLDRIVNDWDLRNMLKHGGWEGALVVTEGGSSRPMNRDEVVEWVRSRIWDLVEESGIDLDKALE